MYPQESPAHSKHSTNTSSLLLAKVGSPILFSLVCKNHTSSSIPTLTFTNVYSH